MSTNRNPYRRPHWAQSITQYKDREITRQTPRSVLRDTAGWSRSGPDLSGRERAPGLGGEGEGGGTALGGGTSEGHTSSRQAHSCFSQLLLGAPALQISAMSLPSHSPMDPDLFDGWWIVHLQIVIQVVPLTPP